MLHRYVGRRDSEGALDVVVRRFLCVSVDVDIWCVHTMLLAMWPVVGVVVDRVIVRLCINGIRCA